MKIGLKVYYKNIGAAKTKDGLDQLLENGELSFADYGVLNRNLSGDLSSTEIESRIDDEFVYTDLIGEHMEVDKERLAALYFDVITDPINNLDVDMTQKLILESINELYNNIHFRDGDELEETLKNRFHVDCLYDVLSYEICELKGEKYDKVYDSLVDQGYLIKDITMDEEYGELVMYALRKDLICIDEELYS